MSDEIDQLPMLHDAPAAKPPKFPRSPATESLAAVPQALPAAEPVRKFYSAKMRGFYSSDVHDTFPVDIVEITEQVWRSLLDAEASGKVLRHNTKGYPYADERNVYERASSLLAQRDHLLTATDWLIARHRDEVEMTIESHSRSLTAEQYNMLQSYRAALRAITKHPQWPNVQLPPLPHGISP